MAKLRMFTGSFFAATALALLAAPAAFAIDFDFGDAPDGQPTGYGAGGAALGDFPSLLASNGARTPDVSVKLGPNADLEADALVVNRDRFDDGVRGVVAPCRTTMLRVTVTLPTVPGAGRGFINMFFDWNRNGRWGGADPCAPEWAVRNFPVDLAAQTATSQEYRIPVPGGVFTNVWYRVTLSVNERLENETGAGQFARGEVEDYPPAGPFFGAKCKPKTLALFHGQAGNFQIVRIPGSVPILSTALSQAQPANTASYQITKNAAPPNSFRFRSKRVDPPKRTVLYIILIRVRFGTPGNVVASIVKKCLVTVTHDNVFFGARCTDLDINHGQSGILRLILLPGSAPILSSGLASSTPANTPNRSITKNGAPPNSFTFRSKKVDLPRRTELYIIRLRVKFGTAGNVVGNITVKCEVRVTHDSPHLTLTPIGNGSGRVTSTPSGISCPPTCTSSFRRGTDVTLTQQADPGSVFTAWGGSGCIGVGACNVRMDGNREVQASFRSAFAQLTVTTSGAGAGIVAGQGINCQHPSGGDCTESFLTGAQVTLNCTGSGPCSFSGCDSGNGTQACGLTMNSSRTVTCTFAGHSPARWSLFSTLRALFRL